jgi:DNA-binding MarR family transcriptional regulator
MSSTTLKKQRPGPRLSEQVCFALYSTGGAVTQAYTGLLAPHNLSYPQFVVLMGLWQKDNISVTALSAIVGLSKGTLTPILKKLETNNFLKRNRVVGNERTLSIVLTAKGHQFAEQAEKIAAEALCATGLNQDEATQLIQLCGKIKSKLSSSTS